MAVLFEVSGEVAVERDLPHDWLNVNATAWVPPLDPDWADEGQQVDGLTIVPASPQILLSMKMLADRERDVADLITLVRHLGIRDAAEAVAIFQEVYPDGPPAREPTEEELTISAQEIIDAAR